MSDTLLEVPEPPVSKVLHAKFEKATDSRGREVHGLWVRNKRFYYQLYLPAKKACRLVSLYDEDKRPILTLQRAQEAVVTLRRLRTEGEMPESRRAPLFSDYRKRYITWLEETESKSDLTIMKEESALKLWSEALGLMRVTQITRRDVNDYVQARKKQGKSNRTANLDVIALSNCLKYAKDEGWLKGKLPTEGFKPLTYKAPERPLRTMEEIDAVCSEAARTDEKGKPIYLNGEMLVDWLRLMQWSGARHNAALSAKWAQVDWENERIKFYTKYSKTVQVDFNSKLEALLRSMAERKIPGTPFLFPSSRINATKGHMTRLYKTLESVKDEVAKKFPAMSDFTPHDLRHFFISWAVMNGLDTMTISSWVGHSDGGVLIGKVYGHLDPGHKKLAAKKMTFSVPETKAPVLSIDQYSAEELVKALQSKIK